MNDNELKVFNANVNANKEALTSNMSNEKGKVEKLLSTPNETEIAPLYAYILCTPFDKNPYNTITKSEGGLYLPGEGDVVEHKKAQPQGDAHGLSTRPGLQSQRQSEQAEDKAADRQHQPMVVFGQVNARRLGIGREFGGGLEQLILTHSPAGLAGDVFLADLSRLAQ